MRRLETAACLGIGSELLVGDRLDTNSLAVARTLARHGVAVVEKRVLPDSTAQLSQALEELLGRVDVVVVTGGLGPTADDITREAVARALGRPLVRDREAEAWIRAKYAALGRPVAEVSLQMADVVEGTTALPNSRGWAPGLQAEVDGRLLFALPGVPWEMEAMLASGVEPELSRRCGGSRRVTRTLLLGGVYESLVEQQVRHLYDRFGRENVTILASPGTVRLLLSAGGDAETVAARLDEMERAFREPLGDSVAGVDVESLEEVVLAELGRRGQTLATAESCTGGLVSAGLTKVPGASTVFRGGVVAYSNEAKEELVGVPHADLVAHGAVSEEVALALARGARERLAADWGIGITGVAGPGGGTPEKPVGLVHWAVAGPSGEWHRQRVFSGDRAVVRLFSAAAALDLLRRAILGKEA